MAETLWVVDLNLKYSFKLLLYKHTKNFLLSEHIV